MIKCLKVAMSCSILLAAAGIAAYAADPTPRQTQTPPQVARDTGIPYSSTPTPGPQAGGSTWIPSEQYQSAGFGETEQGSLLEEGLRSENPLKLAEPASGREAGSPPRRLYMRRLYMKQDGQGPIR